MESVREQYETYPYPLRTPEEDDRMVQGSSMLEDLRIVSHHAYAGRRSLQSFERVLVAGGGTGDAVVLLGWQLKQLGVDAEIVYIDLSEASRAVATRRAARLGLDNVTFVTGSLLDLPTMGLGTFDYINCSGVLHHLPTPEDGARALGQMLASDGCLGAMVYGTIGRHGIYDAQQMLRWIAADLPLDQQLGLARRFLGQLPPTNWLAKSPRLRYRAELDDPEVVDRYLHPCDQAYDVAGCVALAAAGGLEIADFPGHGTYDPELYLRDAELILKARALPRLERYALAERLGGLHTKHCFFAVKEGRGAGRSPRLDEHAVPHVIAGTGPGLADLVARGQGVPVKLDSLTLNIAATPSPLLDATLRGIDGRRTLGEIFRSLPQSVSAKVPFATFLTTFEAIYTPASAALAMVLTRRLQGPPNRRRRG